MLAAYRARRDMVVARIRTMERVACVEPEGGMFVMLDIRESGLGAEEFANRLVESGRRDDDPRDRLRSRAAKVICGCR